MGIIETTKKQNRFSGFLYASFLKAAEDLEQKYHDDCFDPPKERISSPTNPVMGRIVEDNYIIYVLI
jgi:hypothetical protein